MVAKSKLLGSVEAGGTKFVCAVADSNFNIVDQIKFKTSNPHDTLLQTINFFQKFEVSAIGVGSFGPIGIKEGYDDYGFITKTPKVGWSDFDFIGTLKTAINVPIFFTTDVNSSVYGEYQFGTVKKDQTLVYFTLGTGVGVGVIQSGLFVGGRSHPEMGHIILRKHPDDTNFAGVCRFHDDCLEGLASGPSLEARTGVRGENISDDDPVWDIIAYYIAQAAWSATLSFRQDKIIFGGSVSSRPGLLYKARQQFEQMSNDYLPLPSLDDYIVRPTIENNGSATYGNFALALFALQKAENINL
ncbi:fructokinase ScrK [Oenococcus oeni]|uniref:fructokinase ScrK n=1 Tax=Oenococcus oeni TaxID=1247 RepID=UPI000277BBA2|nr:fructokinase ScrK [Oenococcus oeni]AWW99412.1 fructokinase/branched chain amino acid--2-keto-4-methylthiobutyrate aminotransferase [Oenococcus oeni]EJO06137.1 fructokinase [Oenococcus oeni AWRIB553]KEK02483.1 fructokinase [Oenococcus oeni]KER93859.1 fructokinase [Oenococcus oeni]KER95091.1 fructokinase [Oenococcus oeni]